MKIKQVLTKPFILLFFSAVLSALPLTFSNLFLLSWVSFVPFFYVIIKNSGDKFRYVLCRGFLFGLVYHICVYYWFLWFYPLDYVDLTNDASVAVVCLAWFGISALHGALWCLPLIICYIVQKIKNNSLLLSFTAIIGIIAAEKLTGIGELSFPWVRLSLGQYKATALIQSTSLFGVDGLDILILSINALLALCITYPFKKRLVFAACALIIFCTNLGFGIIRLNTDFAGKELTVMTIQASIPQDEKWSNDGDKICFESYSSLTKENITNQVDLVIWPESAVPKIYINTGALKQYKKLSKEIDTPILSGIILKTAGGNTNNTILINNDGPQAIYTKRHMVPFGEYMPYAKTLSKLFPVLTELNIIEDDYISGNDSEIMSIKNGKIGNIICFESIYPELTRQSTLDGAQLMVEATNDSWLKDSPAMYQHLAHGVFRSVENGRYLIRSANSGISAVIDNRGKIIEYIEPNVQGVISETVYFSDKQTLYTKTGDIIFPICCGGVIVWIIITLLRGIKKSAN